MQTKEQMKNWKVVASVATVAALGVSGLAIASPGSQRDFPAPIEIQDQRTSGETFATTTSLGFEVVPAPAFGADSLDSPLASVSFDSPSPDSASPDSLSLDSPSVGSPSTTTAKGTPSAGSPSVDSWSADSPSPDSHHSVDSDDSLDT